jgi:WD40 repeat protein
MYHFPFQGHLVAVGTHKGDVQIWDVAAGKRVSLLEGHSARVGEYHILLRIHF